MTLSKAFAEVEHQVESFDKRLVDLESRVAYFYVEISRAVSGVKDDLGRIKTDVDTHHDTLAETIKNQNEQLDKVSAGHASLRASIDPHVIQSAMETQHNAAMSGV